MGPSASIGICAYNEEHTIGPLLLRLVQIASHCKCRIDQIVVAVNGCTDRTEAIVSQLAEKEPRIRVLHDAVRLGKASALNRLLRYCRSEVFVEVGGDCLPATGALDALLDGLVGPKVGAVTCAQIPVHGSGLAARIDMAFWWLLKSTKEEMEVQGGNQHLGSVMWAARRSLIKEIPPEVVNDDTYLGVLCAEQGFNVRFVPDAVVYFNSAKTLHDILRQRRRINFGHLQIARSTGRKPPIFANLGVRAKLRILSRFARSAPALLPYLALGTVVELCCRALAHLDLRLDTDRHRLWDTAESTKSKLILHS